MQFFLVIYYDLLANDFIFTCQDRPSIEIYRPGMGRFSRQRLEREKGLGKGSSTERESPSSSPSPVPSSTKTSVMSENDYDQ